jgi:two-component system response regulator BaeR
MSTETRVLVVEDDSNLAEILGIYLEQMNFKVSILRRGDTVVAEVRHNPPDVILLDLMLPGKDGIAVCREIREFSMVPVLMITARSKEEDCLLGFDVGADDYICKPFNPSELVARINGILRRINFGIVETELVAGPITIKPESHTVTVDGTNLSLTRNEFELLKALIAQPGNIFSRDDLLAKIYRYNSDLEDRIIDTHIKNLRKKIADILPGHEFIRTMYAMGYYFKVPDTSELYAE